MPRVAAIETLPEIIKLELAAGLKGSGWGDVDGWTAWLAERLAQAGLEMTISRSAVGRFSQKTKAKFEQAWQDAEQTAAMAAVLVANKTDNAAVMQANELLAADGLLRVQLALRDLEDSMESMDEADRAGLVLELGKVQARIMKGVADINKAGIERQQWQEKMRLEERLRAAETAAETAKAAGASSDTVARIREALEKG